MARLFDDASSQYLEITSAVRTAAPFSISMWVYPDATGITNGLAILRNSGTTDDSFTLDITSGNVAQWIARAGSANAIAATANTVTLNAWAHVMVVEAAAASRSVRLNGGTAGTDSTNMVPSGINGFRLGYFQTGGSPSYMSGRIGEVAVWSVALDADEQIALSKRMSPLLIRPQSLVAYWPVSGNDSPELDRWKATFPLTLSGSPTKADAPPIYQPAGAA